MSIAVVVMNAGGGSDRNLVERRLVADGAQADRRMVRCGKAGTGVVGDIVSVSSDQEC